MATELSLISEKRPPSASVGGAITSILTPPSPVNPKPVGTCVVERCVGRLKQWRSVATRYEKRAVNYRAMVVIASLMLWLPS
jgi:hypothetical protein